MNRNRNKILALLASALMLCTACDDKLDIVPLGETTLTTVDELESLEQGMASYAEKLYTATGTDVKEIAGGGAAGGIGAAASQLNAKIYSGAEAVLKLQGFYEELVDADIVITGEGRLDSQSFMGKVVGTVADSALELGVPVYVLAGDVAPEIDAELLSAHGIALAVRCSSSSDPDIILNRAHTDLYKSALGLKEMLIKQ